MAHKAAQGDPGRRAAQGTLGQLHCRLVAALSFGDGTLSLGVVGIFPALLPLL